MNENLFALQLTWFLWWLRGEPFPWNVQIAHRGCVLLVGKMREHPGVLYWGWWWWDAWRVCETAQCTTLWHLPTGSVCACVNVISIFHGNRLTTEDAFIIIYCWTVFGVSCQYNQWSDLSVQLCCKDICHLSSHSVVSAIFIGNDKALFKPITTLICITYHVRQAGILSKMISLHD